MALTFLATTGEGRAATAQAAVVAGQGTAFADTIKVDPRAGNLSIGVDMGKASANHQNTAAQAISQAIDLGTIGTSLASYGCDGSDPTLAQKDQPQPLIADTRTPDAPQEQTVDESFLPGFTKSVRTTTDPFAEAITKTAPMGVQNVISIGGGTSRATSGLVNGVRTAFASADVGSIELAGAVKIGSLHWDAIWTSDGQQDGHFTAGAITVGGVPLPVQNPVDALTQLNTVLDAVGLHITPPGMHIDSGVLFVDPLVISVVPNKARDGLLSTIIAGVQPVREPTFDALLKAYCKSNTEITIADIALGSISGAGSFNLLFGGAMATSGEITTNAFNLGFVGLGGGSVLGGGNESISLPGVSGSTGTGVLGATGNSGATSAPSSGNSATNAAPAAAAATKTKGERGGAMAAVGLGSLLLLALLAEGDRRKMRRAQREIPVLA
jgi:hypothetical protein